MNKNEKSIKKIDHVRGFYSSLIKLSIYFTIFHVPGEPPHPHFIPRSSHLLLTQNRFLPHLFNTPGIFTYIYYLYNIRSLNPFIHPPTRPPRPHAHTRTLYKRSSRTCPLVKTRRLCSSSDLFYEPNGNTDEPVVFRGPWSSVWEGNKRMGSRFRDRGKE